MTVVPLWDDEVTQRIEDRVCERTVWERMIYGTWYRFTVQRNSAGVLITVDQWWADAEHYSQVHQFVW